MNYIALDPNYTNVRIAIKIKNMYELWHNCSNYGLI